MATVISANNKGEATNNLGVSSGELTVLRNGEGWPSADSRKQSAKGKAGKQSCKQQVNHKGASSAVVQGEQEQRKEMKAN